MCYSYGINSGQKTRVPADDPHAKVTLHNERHNGALHRASDAYQGGQRQLRWVLLERERLRTETKLDNMKLYFKIN